MAASRDTQLAVASLINLVANNNPTGALGALKNIAGYKTEFDIMSAPQVESLLWQLYNADKNRFWAVMQAIPYRTDKLDWTTSPQTISKLQNLAGAVQPVATARGFNPLNWFETIVDVVESKDKEETVTTIKEQEKTPTGAYVAYIILALLVIGLLIFLFRKGII